MAKGSRGNEVTPSARVLVRTTYILLAFTMSGPAMDLIELCVRQGSLRASYGLRLTRVSN